MSAHLSDEDRATLLTPCGCGHDFNDHGDLAGCWTCPELEPARTCDVLGSELMAQRIEAVVRRRITEALTEAAADAAAIDRVTRGSDIWADIASFIRVRIPN